MHCERREILQDLLENDQLWACNSSLHHQSVFLNSTSCCVFLIQYTPFSKTMTKLHSFHQLLLPCSWLLFVPGSSLSFVKNLALRCIYELISFVLLSNVLVYGFDLVSLCFDLG